eukprot:m.202862 g.202862  ORF g.202862 m.202862 type:complete len:386 (-) comp17066_c0_seq2:395-1552(-)
MSEDDSAQTQNDEWQQILADNASVIIYEGGRPVRRGGRSRGTKISFPKADLAATSNQVAVLVNSPNGSWWPGIALAKSQVDAAILARATPDDDEEEEDYDAQYERVVVPFGDGTVTREPSANCRLLQRSTLPLEDLLLQPSYQQDPDMLAALDFCDDGTLPPAMAWVLNYNRSKRKDKARRGNSKRSEPKFATSHSPESTATSSTNRSPTRRASRAKRSPRDSDDNSLDNLDNGDTEPQRGKIARRGGKRRAGADKAGPVAKRDKDDKDDSADSVLATEPEAQKMGSDDDTGNKHDNSRSLDVVVPDSSSSTADNADNDATADNVSKTDGPSSPELPPVPLPLPHDHPDWHTLSHEDKLHVLRLRYRLHQRYLKSSPSKMSKSIA